MAVLIKNVQLVVDHTVSDFKRWDWHIEQLIDHKLAHDGYYYYMVDSVTNLGPSQLSRPVIFRWLPPTDSVTIEVFI
jgi:hypothetical protein